MISSDYFNQHLASLIIDIGWYIGGSGVNLIWCNRSEQVEILSCDCDCVA